MIVAWLIQAASPDAPYPFLNLEGEQVSAKSTASKLLRSVIDPSVAPIRTLPRNERDLLISAINSRILAYDNQSGLTDQVSESLDRLSSGSGISSKELYTNGSKFILNAANPIILTGIDQIATRNDLADRSITIYLPAISDDQRVLERRLWPQFEIMQPRLLGCICDALSCALRRQNQVELDRMLRMADFAYWVTAAEPALQRQPGEFLQAYYDSQSQAERRSCTLTTSPWFCWISWVVKDGGQAPCRTC